MQKPFCFVRSRLLIVLIACAVVLHSGSWILSSRLSPALCFIRLRVSGITLKSLIDLEFSFVYTDKYTCISTLVHTAIQSDQHCLLQVLSFLQGVFLACQKIKNKNMVSRGE